jgi:NAD(P)-dependent dehydrogenase (short-subunit alcohol dehydrogenase family)
VRAALVTGASSGIGLAIGRMLVEEEFALTVASRRQERIEAAARELGDVHAVAADVAEEADCRRLVAAHQARFGRLDVLVNSAGVLEEGAIEALPAAGWDRQFAVNVRAPFLLMQLALPLLKASRGWVVNLASLSGKVPNPGLAAYGASKAALISLTQSFNAEAEPFGVRAVALCPGFVDTPMAGYSDVSPAEMIRPEDCAEVVRMLLRLGPRARGPELVIERVRGA